MSLGKITLEIQSSVQGPAGKLKAGTIVALEDSDYVRLLVKSGNVVLIDPPSLDEDYLIRAGLIEAPVVEGVVEEPKSKKEAVINSLNTSGYLTKKAPKVSEPVAQEEVLEEDGDAE